LAQLHEVIATNCGRRTRSGVMLHPLRALCHRQRASSRVAAAPGERKSAVQQAMSRPIFDVEQQLADAGVAARLEAETRNQVAKKAAEKLKHEAAKAAHTDAWDTAIADAIGAAEIADEIKVPAVPRIVADDVTPEAAASLLAEHAGRLAIMSAEGGIFDIIAGRYSRLPNMDLWLKGHSGDPVKVERKGREPEYVRRPALTLGLMIQLGAVHDRRQPRVPRPGAAGPLPLRLPGVEGRSAHDCPRLTEPGDRGRLQRQDRGPGVGYGWMGR
jgi:hypothetical protein